MRENVITAHLSHANDKYSNKNNFERQNKKKAVNVRLIIFIDYYFISNCKCNFINFKSIELIRKNFFLCIR